MKGKKDNSTMALNPRQTTGELFQCNGCGKYLNTVQGLKSHTTRLHRPVGTSQPHPNTLNETEDTSSISASNECEDQDPHETSLLDAPDSEDFLLELIALRSRTKIIRRVPKAARSDAATSLSKAIDQCLKDNSVLSWKRLARFASFCFSVPTLSSVENNNNKVSLATVIKRNVKNYDDNYLNYGRQDSSPTNNPVCALPDPRQGDKPRIPVKLIESKIADGDVSGAVRLLCSEMTLAPFNTSTLQILKDKHPEQEPISGTQRIAFQNETSLDSPPFPITTEGVRAAIASFPPGSAAGLDMLKPQHLKDLTSHSAGQSGMRLLVSLVNLCSHMLCGRVPEAFCSFLYGASLFALNKKDGGVRPIAVGNTLRRLTAKLGCSFAMTRLENYFKPIQFGFGIKGGAEAVAHAARRFISFEHSSPKVFLKLDFQNAFNSVNRQVVLEEAATHIPELSPFLAQCYGQSTQLAFGPHLIASSSGIQQGDPLGPALFCLAIQPLAQSLTTEINLWYLDDSSLGGSADSVLCNLKSVISKSTEIGLTLNLSKCELFIVNVPEDLRSSLRASFSAEAPGIRFPDDEDFSLLGAPLKEPALTKAIMSKTSDLESLAGRLESLSSHYALHP